VISILGLLDNMHGQWPMDQVQSMRQADMHGVAKFVTHWLGVYSSADPAGGGSAEGVQASDQP